MSEPKWTRGPWRAVPNPMRGHGLFVVKDEPYRHTGVRRADGTEVMSLPPAVIPVQLDHADANLIAAAPELYEALEFVMERVVDEAWPTEATITFAVAQAETALARARGEEGGANE